MPDTRPIGIFDSGLGGLSVARAIAAHLPQENLVYAADCAYAPWGERDDAYISARVDHVVDFLLATQAKAIVIACNTATAVCAEHLRAKLSIPVIGIEPAVLPATRTTKSGRIGVMATTKTLTSTKYAHLKAQVAGTVDIHDCPCPGLMDCVEAGEFETPRTMRLLNTLITPLTSSGVDTLVLGCTHYPFLTPAIERIAGEHVTLIDPAPAVARQLKRRLADKDLLNMSGVDGLQRFYASGADAARNQVLKRLWGPDATLLTLP